MKISSPVAGGRAASGPYPEYDKLFAGNLLPVTLGVGFDEDGWHRPEQREVLGGLKARGFQKLDVAALSDADLRGQGIDPAVIDRQGTYFVKTVERPGDAPLKVLVKYVDVETPNARDRFADGFTRRGLVIYAGHARYGSGPDFDAKESPNGNLVLGTPYSSHMADILRGVPNALTQHRMTDDYQLMLLHACKTKNYLDELRSIPANKNTANLDVLASTSDVYWGDYSESALAMLDMVLAQKSAPEMLDKLSKLNPRSTFLADGFEDNTSHG